jgi:hypothetical protein
VAAFIQEKPSIPTYPFNYRGLVVDDADPLNADRVRVRVYPMFTSLPVTTIPWAVPAPRIVSGAGSGYGESMVPEVGSWVFVFFEAGDIQQPVYFASAPSSSTGIPAAHGTRKKVIQTKGGTEVVLDDVSGDLKVSTPSGLVFELTSAGKVKLGTPTADLITILSSFLDMFSLTGELINDPLPGGSPLLEFKSTVIVTAAALKLQLDTLKA